MSPVLQRLLPPSKVQIHRCIRELAEASLDAARDRLHATTEEMNRSQLRGYIRGRARRVVVSQARRTLPLQLVQADVVVEQAIELLTQRLVRESMARPVDLPVARAA